MESSKNSRRSRRKHKKSSSVDNDTVSVSTSTSTPSLDRQQRRDVRRLNRCLRKYGDNNQRVNSVDGQQQQVQQQSNQTNSGSSGESLQPSTSSSSTQSLRIIRQQSSSDNSKNRNNNNNNNNNNNKNRSSSKRSKAKSESNQTDSGSSGESSQPSTSSSSTQSLRIIRQQSSSDNSKNRNNNNNNNNKNRSSSKRSKAKSESNRNKRSGSGDNDTNDLRYYLGLAVKNSLGHMHDHIIATLPTEMSLYYQKFHDTILMDVDNSNSNNQRTTSKTSSAAAVAETTKKTKRTMTNKQSGQQQQQQHQQMNEMHEFISSSSIIENDDQSGNIPDNNNSSSTSSSNNQKQSSSGNNNNNNNNKNFTSTNNNRINSNYNPYAPPPSRPVGLPIKDFLNDPVNASLSTLNRVTNLVRVPTSQIYTHGYNILNTLANPVNTPNTPGPSSSGINNTNSNTTRTPGMAERIVKNGDKNNSNGGNNNDDENQFNSIPLPPPVLPLIQCTQQQTRFDPLNLEEFQSNHFTLETLCQRVFKGGVSQELRLRIWPFILGLYDNNEKNLNDEEIFQMEKQKEFDWIPKQKLFEHYRSQWRSILPEQEKRFMLFRERKSLIERDVIRCDRTHPFYLGDKNENLDKLKELLLTYMMYDFDTGYVQGMSDLASPLLYVAKGDVCKAFWFFVKIMEFTNNNFEMSQLTIKNQLEMLWKLIELTDPIFAQYLANNESVNCYFAFRWIVCQFKREFMKYNSDDYQEILLLWESIWTCSSMRRYFEKLKQDQQQQQKRSTKTNKSDELTDKSSCSNNNEQNQNIADDDDKSEKINSNDLVENLTKQCKIDEPLIELDDNNKSNDEKNTSDAEKQTSEQSKKSSSNKQNNCDNNNRNETNNIAAMMMMMDGTMQRRLSDTELYVLCICLAIIRRERDLIMAQRFDATEILKHFNTLHLTSNLKQILIHAANIWSWLIFDENEKLLYRNDDYNHLELNDQEEEGEENQDGKILNKNKKYGNNINNKNNNNDINLANQSIDTEDFDLLQDLRLPLDRSSTAEDYFLFGNV